MRQNKQGFTLVEILVAVSVVTLVMVSVSSGVIFSIKNSRYSQEKSTSIRQSQQGIEWIRGMRDQVGWDTFWSVVNVGATTRVGFCLDSIQVTPTDFQSTQFRSGTLQILAANETIETCDDTNGDGYQRQLILDLVDGGASPSNVDITSIVTWGPEEENYETILNNALYEW